MTSFDELYEKYAAKSPIKPPKPHKEVKVSIPKLKVPEIGQLSEKEMKDWEDFIAGEKLQKDLDVTKEITDIGDETKLLPEEGTIPAIPGKKANLSPDTLLKMCSQYHDLCRKL